VAFKTATATRYELSVALPEITFALARKNNTKITNMTRSMDDEETKDESTPRLAFCGAPCPRRGWEGVGVTNPRCVTDTA
jgi:hypothetical protein